VQRQAADLVAELKGEAEAADRDLRLLARLPDVRGPREGPKFRTDDKGVMAQLAEPSADEQFADAFREWGLDVDATPTAEAAARLTGRPPAVVTEVIAALDEWAEVRRQQGRPEAEWARLAALAAALDDDPGPTRRELRAILARRQLPVERALGALSAALRPVPVPVAVPLGADRGRLRQLAGQVEPASEPVLGLLTLTRALRVAGEEALAEQLLRAAIAARPREVVLYHALGQLLQEQEPPRWAEAEACYTAARALRPHLGESLATALIGSGHDRQGLALLDRLVKETPDNPYLHGQQGRALHDKGDLEGAIACYRKVIALAPKGAIAHYNLGNALHDKGDLEGAIACFRQAIALDPTLAPAHTSLGVALRDKGDLAGAIACWRKAITLDPKDAPAHNNLGAALYGKGDVEGAVACYRRALALAPKGARVHFNLGLALRDKGDLEGAVACYRRALALAPKGAQVHFKHAEAHGALGQALLALGRWAEARDATRRCLDLLPPRHPLRAYATQQLQRCERMLALEARLPAVLQGKEKPAGAERPEFAGLCQATKRYAAAARFYADAFAADPKLAADLRAAHRYNAACAAALAAAGQGEDARKLADEDRTRLRKQALDWLRADLTAQTKQLKSWWPGEAGQAREALRHWQKDADLAGLREKAALDKLPAAERDAWQRLWADVAALLKRAQEK
jgi:tetratricopeptide (TPR) repeat protein